MATMPCYYMGSSVSGQDDLNRALWLATRAGKMEPSCPLGTTRCIPQANFHRKPYNKSFIDQVCLVKMAGYWRRSFFASLWTSTSSRSTNTQKKNLANIQPSWPHTWSITHTYCIEREIKHWTLLEKKKWRISFSCRRSLRHTTCYCRTELRRSSLRLLPTYSKQVSEPT